MSKTINTNHLAALVRLETEPLLYPRRAELERVDENDHTYYYWVATAPAGELLDWLDTCAEQHDPAREQSTSAMIQDEYGLTLGMGRIVYEVLCKNAPLAVPGLAMLLTAGETPADIAATLSDRKELGPVKGEYLSLAAEYMAHMRQHYSDHAAYPEFAAHEQEGGS